MSGKANSRHPSIAQCFGGQITGDHFDRLCAMLGKARKRPLTNAERAHARGRFEELAAQFLMRQRYLKSGQTPTQKKKALDRLESAAKRFMRALDGIDRSLWLDLDMRLDLRPEGFTSDISEYVFGDDSASPEAIYRHFEIVAALERAAQQTRVEMTDTKAKQAKRKYEAARWLALQLAPLYTEATGRPARANSSPSYACHPWVIAPPRLSGSSASSLGPSR